MWNLNFQSSCLTNIYNSLHQPLMQQGDHFLWRKGYPYEASAKVPFILRLPLAWRSVTARDGLAGKTQNARRSDAVVELRDVLPTLLDAAGAPPPPASARVEGASVLPLLRGGLEAVSARAGWRRWIDLEHSKVRKVSSPQAWA